MQSYNSFFAVFAPLRETFFVTQLRAVAGFAPAPSAMAKS